jgi:hypothetical protein
MASFKAPSKAAGASTTALGVPKKDVDKLAKELAAVRAQHMHGSPSLP